MKRGFEFLTVGQVTELHQDQIDAFGGDAGIKDLALLESAVAQPQSTFDGKFLHENLLAMAAAYAYRITENHPFVDGNKRTGLAAALVFLALNGIEVSPGDTLYDAMMAIAEHKLDKQGFATILVALATPASE